MDLGGGVVKILSKLCSIVPLVIVAFSCSDSTNASVTELDPDSETQSIPFQLDECSAEDTLQQRSRCIYSLSKKAKDAKAAAISLLENLANEHPSSPWPKLYLGLSQWTDRGRAEGLMARAAADFQKLGDVRREAYCRRKRIELLLLDNDGDETRRELDRLSSLVSDSSEPARHIELRITKARVLAHLDRDLEGAFALLKQDEEQIRACLNPRSQSEEDRVCQALESEAIRHWFYWLASVAFELGDYRQTRGLQAYVLGTREASAATAGYIVLLADLATKLPSFTARQALEKRTRETLELALTESNHPIEARLRHLIGQLASPIEAAVHANRCRDLLATSRLGAMEQILCLDLMAVTEARANLSGAGERAERVERILRQAREIAAEANDSWTALAVLAAGERAYWNLGDFDREDQIGMELLREIESIRAQQESGTGMAAVVSAWWEVYLRRAGRSLEQDSISHENLERAFHIIERMRARTLLDSLGERGSKGPEEQFIASLAAVRANLHEDEALLSFQYSLKTDFLKNPGGGAWLIVSTRDGSSAYELPDRQSLEEYFLKTDFFNLYEFTKKPEVLKHLHRMLLAGALDGLPATISHLTIVPDGIFHQIPWEMLRAESDMASSIAARFRVSYAPSATLWLRLRMSGVPSRTTPRPGLIVAAPDPGIPTMEGKRPEFLYHAVREGQRIVRHLGPGSRLIKGPDAFESSIKTIDLKTYSILHFATHAQAAEHRDQSPALLLGTGDEREDGRLNPREIAGLDLTDQIVVLASCESARGDLIRGEGIMSLARAFFVARARTVVASRKELNDQESARLFDSFYEQLSRGLSVGEALSFAQRERMKYDETPSEGWGALVLLGDGNARPFAGGLVNQEGSYYARIWFLVAVAASALLMLRLITR